MTPEPPDQHPEETPALPAPEEARESGKTQKSESTSRQDAENWFAGVGAGMKGASRKLLEQLPPDLQEKIVEKARTHGPGSAAAAVEAAAMKTRSLKVKLALKGLGKLLKVIDLKLPEK